MCTFLLYMSIYFTNILSVGQATKGKRASLLMDVVILVLLFILLHLCTIFTIWKLSKIGLKMVKLLFGYNFIWYIITHQNVYFFIPLSKITLILHAAFLIIVLLFLPMKIIKPSSAGTFYEENRYYS